MASARVTSSNSTGQGTRYSPAPAPSAVSFTGIGTQAYSSSQSGDWLGWARIQDRDYSLVLVEPPEQFSFLAVCYRHNVLLVFWYRAGVSGGREDEFMITYNNGARETVGEKEAARIILDFLEVPLDSRGEMR